MLRRLNVGGGDWDTGGDGDGGGEDEQNGEPSCEEKRRNIVKRADRSFLKFAKAKRNFIDK